LPTFLSKVGLGLGKNGGRCTFPDFGARERKKDSSLGFAKKEENVSTKKM
jgi:hypothetical protein